MTALHSTRVLSTVSTSAIELSRTPLSYHERNKESLKKTVTKGLKYDKNCHCSDLYLVLRFWFFTFLFFRILVKFLESIIYRILWLLMGKEKMIWFVYCMFYEVRSILYVLNANLFGKVGWVIAVLECNRFWGLKPSVFANLE